VFNSSWEVKVTYDNITVAICSRLLICFVTRRKTSCWFG